MPGFGSHLGALPGRMAEFYKGIPEQGQAVDR